MPKTLPPRQRTPIPGVLTTLVAWTSLCVTLIGWLEAETGHATFAEVWIQRGLIGVGVGVLLTAIVAYFGYFRLGKSAIIWVGASPFIVFALFIQWRKTVSEDQRLRCFERNEAEACRILSEVRAKRGHPEDAVSLMLHGCELGDARSCRALGGQLQRRPALHTSTALDAFSRACDLGDGLGCDRAGQLVRADSPDAAAEFFARGCAAGYASSCH